MAVGASIITLDGINALVEASSTGRSVRPKYFRCSAQDLVLDPNLSAGDIHAWRTQDISLYHKIDEHTVEFVCDVIPSEATDYTRIVGLYLDDGTLFMVAKPPYPFPPMLRQTFKIQMVYQNASGLLDFQYVPFSEEEQSLATLDTSISLGLEAIKNGKEAGLNRSKLTEVLKDVTTLKEFKMAADEKFAQIDEDRLSALDNHLFLSMEMIKNATLLGQIKTKIIGG